MNNVVTLNRASSELNVAVVESTSNGRATRVLWPEKSEQPLAVYAHLAHVGRINRFDEVLVQQTDKGLVIVGLLASKQQAPAAHIEDVDGVVTVRGAKAVRLLTDNATIEVTAKGSVAIDGKQIYQQAEHAMTLKGYPIELN